MYELNDTFNNQIISRHRTIGAAVKADIRHARAVIRNAGMNTHIPTSITHNGDTLTWGELEDVDAAESRAACYGIGAA